MKLLGWILIQYDLDTNRLYEYIGGRFWEATQGGDHGVGTTAEKAQMFQEVRKDAPRSWQTPRGPAAP